jgi:probable DNA repair protein
VKFPSGRLDFLLLHDAIAAGTRVTIVTPNERLATYLQQEYDEAQRGAGRLAWDTADILPLETFTERLYRSLTLDTGKVALPQLLSGIQCQYLWEELVGKSAGRDGLLSIAQAAKHALSAWQLMHHWRLLPAMRNVALHEDARVFMLWVQQYQQFCRERNLIDTATLPDFLATLMHGREARVMLPEYLLSTGFDIVTPQHQGFFEACRAAGVQWQPAAADRGQASAALKRLEFADETEELRHCATWARQQVERNPQARIAIVVPNLQARRQQITRALTDVLLPLEGAQVRRHYDQTMGLFNVSLGEPLGDCALVRDALSLIEFSQGRAQPFLVVSALLRSPYIAGAGDEIARRALLDAVLRESAAPEISLFSLHRKLKLANTPGLAPAALSCEILCARIDQVVTVGGLSGRPRGDGRTQRSPQDWGKHFADTLSAWGFPGSDRLDSVEYQVLGKFHEALASLATLGAVTRRMKSADALAQLRRILADTVFQPQSPASTAVAGPPIQVLGILESAGQIFDALWVTGLSSEAWPLAARPAPFIPAVLQRSAGVTEASAAASLALDQRITDGWRHNAAEVVFSHAHNESGRNANEQMREASALTRTIPLSVPAELLLQTSHPGYAGALQEVGVREQIPDLGFAVLPAPTTIRGGTSVIRDQAACPFRAFARHRLLARTLEAPHAGLDAAERGNLLHRVLSLAWGQIGSHAGLVSLDGAAVDNVLQDAAAQAIAEESARGTEILTGRFATIERARLIRMLREWLQYERERAPFEVVERERKRQVIWSGLAMNVRLDRLDRLADGTHALIDYKTGAAKFTSWLGNRPDEPQLPLYLVTAQLPVSVLAFAKVKRGERGKVFGFEGVSVVENLLPDVAPIEQKRGMEKKGYASWDVLVQEWETALDGLAGGAAQVDPKYGSQTCTQCDLQSLCRVAEISAYASLEDGADGEPDGDAESGYPADE